VSASKRARRQGRDASGKFTSGKASVGQRVRNRRKRGARAAVAARRFEERDRAEAGRSARPKRKRK
jgi:hypothetical protein